jgi:DNA-binding response OmpR family regulator
MHQILIVEDDPAILRGLKDNLEYESYTVFTARDGEEGYRLVHAHRPDLIVLDLMLPKMDGYELCQKIRGEGMTLPVLMLTARSEETDRVRGLDLGADDYITKPFSVPELLARIRAILRRSKPSTVMPERIQFDDVMIDFTCFEAHKADAVLKLSRKEFGVLRLLASRAGQVITRNELLDEVWGHDYFPTTRTVDNHIASLRAKLENDPAQPTRLVTMHGVGYKLVLET